MSVIYRRTLWTQACPVLSTNQDHRSLWVNCIFDNTVNVHVTIQSTHGRLLYCSHTVTVLLFFYNSWRNRRNQLPLRRTLTLTLSLVIWRPSTPRMWLLRLTLPPPHTQHPHSLHQLYSLPHLHRSTLPLGTQSPLTLHSPHPCTIIWLPRPHHLTRLNDSQWGHTQWIMTLGEMTRGQRLWWGPILKAVVVQSQVNVCLVVLLCVFIFHCLWSLMPMCSCLLYPTFACVYLKGFICMLPS